MAAALLAPAADAGWSRVARLDGPQSRDILPALIGFSPQGQAAIAFGVQNEDDPAVSSAFVALRPASGRFHRARRIPRAREPLAVGFQAQRLALLTGNAPRRRACCGSVEVILSRAGRTFGSRATLVRGLTGDTEGRLATLAGGQLLAAVATQRGVWVAQSNVAGRFGPEHRLSSTGAPQTLGAVALAGGGSVVAWSTAVGAGEVDPRRIEVAVGSPTAAPTAPRVVVTVPSGHSVDELALAAGAGEPTVAWIESWVDGHGGYHSRVETATVRRGARGRAVSPAGELASQLSFVANEQGRQLLAWQGCERSGACVARVASRRRSSAGFGRAERLGVADSAEAPAAALAPDGGALVGWISGGNVLVRARGPSGARFGRVRTISGSGLDADIAIAFGPGRGALAAWTQGTLAPSVFASAYHAS
jgi:hypothetical protein